MTKIQKVFRAPAPHCPNGMQGTDDGLWLIDQKSDQIIKVDEFGMLLAALDTDSENSSGLTFGDGSLWAASNGKTEMRDFRPTDRHQGVVLRIDPASGRTIGEHAVPGGTAGGIHGLDWSDGTLWLTTLRLGTLSQVRPADFSVLHSFPVAYSRAHGLAWESGFMWCVYTSDRVIVKHDPLDGRVVETIEVPEPEPEPHGLTLWQGDLWYCDVKTGWVCRLER